MSHLPLSDGHPVVVHLLEVELLVDIERLGGLPQHELELAQSPPPDAAVSGLNLSRHIDYKISTRLLVNRVKLGQ